VSVAVYRTLSAVYREQEALLAEETVDIDRVRDAMQRAEQLLTEVDEPRDDPELAAAAAEALQAQQAAGIALRRHHAALRAVAAGARRGADALKAYGSGAGAAPARYIDRRH